MEIERFKQLEGELIPDDFDYQSVQGLSHECCQKLQESRPLSLGQAARISGVTPAAMTSLMIRLHQVRQ